jgi:AsmA protein
MEQSVKTIGLKIAKISGISFAILLLAMILFPILFPNTIADEVKKFANGKLNGELNFKEANLSFFNHFPSLTLTLTQFSLKGSQPYKDETLLKAQEVAFGINVKSLIFDKKVKIDKIFISDALVNVKVNEKGEANYNVYVSDEKETSNEPSTASIRLDKIDIEDCHLVYDDKSAKIQIDAKGFNYIGKGDLDQSIFDLYTEAEIDSLDFTFDNETYLKNKRVKADLITKINTNSLSFIFEQNDLKINKLPVEFIGKFDFLKNGYNLDFTIDSKDSKLNDFFTALPPQYVTWLDKTKVKGRTDISLTLKGKYIASTNSKPNLAFNMKIREGKIDYKDAPFPVTNLYLNFDTKLPSLDTEQLKFNLDSIFFNVGTDYFKAIVKTTGLKTPLVDATIKASLDLQKMDRAFGFENMDLKGSLKMDVTSKGKYDKNNKIVPVTKGDIALKNTTIKTEYYPHPIENVNLIAKISNANGTLKDLKVAIHPASFVFEGKPFYLNASFQNFEDIAYDIKAKGEIDVAKIYKVFSQKGLDVEGYLKADVAFQGKQSDATNGNYNKLNNSGTLLLRNIKTTSEYLPKPFIIKEGLFTFKQDGMSFTNFTATYGASDFNMNGSMQNVINFALSDNAVLKGDFSFSSNYINVDEFLSGATTTPTTAEKTTSNTPQPATESGVIVIPSNLNLNLTAAAKKLTFGELNIADSKGNLVINHGKLMLNNASLNLIDCNVNMNAVYGSEATNRAFFDFKILAKDFDIKRAYNEIKMFREMASAAEKAEGIVSLDYKVAGKLDGNMQPIYPSLVGGGKLSVRKVKMMGFKMFGAVSKKTETEAIKNPDVTEVVITTAIKNNIITIDRFKFKVAGFRPRIEGTTSFDGKLNIKMRLGLPPLGILGIPMTITGTQENPKVKLGKQTEDLQETEYVESQKTPVVQPQVPVQEGAK